MCSCTPDARHSAKNIDCQQNQRPYIPCLPQDPLFKSDQQCIETPFPPQKFSMSERLLAHPVAPPPPPRGSPGVGSDKVVLRRKAASRLGSGSLAPQFLYVRKAPHAPTGSFAGRSWGSRFAWKGLCGLAIQFLRVGKASCRQLVGEPIRASPCTIKEEGLPADQ